MGVGGDVECTQQDQKVSAIDRGVPFQMESAMFPSIIFKESRMRQNRISV